MRTNPPTAADFFSHKALGRPRRGAPVDQWEGVSTFADPSIAADLARRWNHGGYLARLSLEPDGAIRWAKTRGPGHYTIWGTPAEMLARVSEVIPVGSIPEGAES